MNYRELPENCTEILRIDMQKSKKTALLVNLLSLAIAVILVIISLYIVSWKETFDISNFYNYLIKISVLLVSMIAYIVLHELVHGLFFRVFGKMRPTYGFTGIYGYCGSRGFYDRRSYLIICLAPIVIWGIVLLILNIVVPASWFMVVYIIQIINISGAAGDLYVFVKLMKMPRDILVNDNGLSMTVYSMQNK